jgi:hypothetical protein
LVGFDIELMLFNPDSFQACTENILRGRLVVHLGDTVGVVEEAER